MPSPIFTRSAQFGCCWLRPIDPPQRTPSFADFLFHPEDLTPANDLLLADEVRSLQPVLRWESSPEPRDLTPANEAVLRRIDDVRYELRVFGAPEGFPAQLVCDLFDLRTPQARPGESLGRHFHVVHDAARVRLQPVDARPAGSRPTNGAGYAALRR